MTYTIELTNVNIVLDPDDVIERYGEDCFVKMPTLTLEVEGESPAASLNQFTELTGWVEQLQQAYASVYAQLEEQMERAADLRIKYEALREQHEPFKHWPIIDGKDCSPENLDAWRTAYDVKMTEVHDWQQECERLEGHVVRREAEVERVTKARNRYREEAKRLTSERSDWQQECERLGASSDTWFNATEKLHEELKEARAALTWEKVQSSIWRTAQAIAQEELLAARKKIAKLEQPLLFCSDWLKTTTFEYTFSLDDVNIDAVRLYFGLPIEDDGDTIVRGTE